MKNIQTPEFAKVLLKGKIRDGRILTKEDYITILEVIQKAVNDDLVVNGHKPSYEIKRIEDVDLNPTSIAWNTILEIFEFIPTNITRNLTKALK